jgi:hypothetical protein
MSRDEPHLYQGGYEPPEHPDPASVDDAATRRVAAFNEAQRLDVEADQRWTELKALHSEPYRDAAHRPEGPGGGYHVGGTARPPRSDRRGWDNKRDDPHREDEFVPPDQMPVRGTRPGFVVIKPLIDLTPAVDRRTGGSGVSFAESVAAAQAARSYTENEVAGAVLLTDERTNSAGEAVRLAKSGVESAVAQFMAAWGNLDSGHLNTILRMFAGIQEKLDEMLRALNAVQDMANDILAALEGIGWAVDEFVNTMQAGQ